LPEIVRRVDRLNAIIIQPAAEPDSVSLFRFREGRIAGPVLFDIERRLAAATADLAAKMKPQSMESRVEEAIGLFVEPEAVSAASFSEQLAILKRWYYRSQRVGEIFYADETDDWPLRRMVRAIGRVYRGERPQEAFSFSATESSAPPSQPT
jgi:hypothetical protein